MKVSLTYVDADRRNVPFAAAAENPAGLSEHYNQLPVRLGEFQPVVTRRSPSSGLVNLDVTWLYIDPAVETEQLEDTDLPSEFDGCIIPADSLLIPTAPQWLEVGFEYARAVYAPLFRFDKKAAPGLSSMARTHPDAFKALAREKNVGNHIRGRFALATLVSKWDLMERLGLRVTEQARIDEYAKVTGTDVSTLRGIEAVKQRICRELRKARRASSR